ncbi:ATP-dependent nuclease [Actinophytocola sp. NPDC049390]|uniref:ATP-dependent nuclease n=1 Tax=Actinophytocola sp. NPDC049390 TaxID=3363894 RepID=UPI0037B1BCF3
MSELDIQPRSESGFYISSIELAGDQPPIQLSPGTVTAIVGGNNTGKTTLLKQINGWLQNVTQPPIQVDEHRILTRLEVAKGEDAQQFIKWVHNNCEHRKPNAINPHMPEGYVRSGTVPMTEEQLRQAWITTRNGHLGNIYPFLVYVANAGELGHGFSTGMRDRPDDPPTHPLHYLERNMALREKVDELCIKVFNQHITVDTLGKNITLRLGTPPDDISPPGYNDDPLSYREALDKLPKLDGQGHGMRSLLGKLFPILTATHPIIIIDEPEAFLHPPQATIFGRLIGDITRDSGVQVILATHDRNILVGLLESKSPVSVVRLTRVNGRNDAYQLSTEEISRIWSDPVLRYSHVLDGLFHQRVVLVEHDRDCTFYSAALDAAHEDEPLPVNPSDILFVPTNGKDGMAPVAQALSSIKVPVIASPDIDILDDENKMRRLVTALGADWSEYREQFQACTSYLRAPKEPVLAASVASKVQAYLDGILKQDPRRLWDRETREEFRSLTRGGNNSWEELKKHGVRGFRKDVETSAYNLLDRLDRIGLVIVREGTLESFGIGYSVTERKGLNWLRSALDKGAHRSTSAMSHARRLVTSMPALPPVVARSTD